MGSAHFVGNSLGGGAHARARQAWSGPVGRGACPCRWLDRRRRRGQATRALLRAPAAHDAPQRAIHRHRHETAREQAPGDARCDAPRRARRPRGRRRSCADVGALPGGRQGDRGGDAPTKACRCRISTVSPAPCCSPRPSSIASCRRSVTPRASGVRYRASSRACFPAVATCRCGMTRGSSCARSASSWIGTSSRRTPSRQRRLRPLFQARKPPADATTSPERDRRYRRIRIEVELLARRVDRGPTPPAKVACAPRAFRHTTRQSNLLPRTWSAGRRCMSRSPAATIPSDTTKTTVIHSRLAGEYSPSFFLDCDMAASYPPSQMPQTSEVDGPRAM